MKLVVPVLVRMIEASGIPTVTVTMMPELSQKYRSSRLLGVEFPFGRSLGVVGDAEMQARTLQAAHDLLVTAPKRETRVDLDVTWPGDARQAYKDWQPSEPSPIVKHNLDVIRKARRAAANKETGRSTHPFATVRSSV